MKKCSHYPFIKIIFDAGMQTTEYFLCDYCSKHPIFQTNVLNTEKFSVGDVN
jgi:hypothetical protein